LGARRPLGAATYNYFKLCREAQYTPLGCPPRADNDSPLANPSLPQADRHSWPAIVGFLGGISPSIRQTAHLPRWFSDT